MNKQELFNQINELYQAFVEGHNGTTRRSQVEARKSLQGIKKLITDYKKASTAEQKA
jgi:hypothetical protein